MPAIPHLKERFERSVQRQIDKDQETGFLGILVSGAYVFAVEHKPGYAHCRIERGRGLEAAECLVEVALDPYTRCKFRREGGVLVAYEFFAPDAAANYGADGRLLNVPGLPMLDRGSLSGASDGVIGIEDGVYTVLDVNARIENQLIDLLREGRRTTRLTGAGLPGRRRSRQAITLLLGWPYGSRR